MAITTNIDGLPYQWANQAELTGWFTPEELKGEVALPTQDELFSREIRLEQIVDELNGRG